MIKQIEIRGRRVKLFSMDEGRTWGSNPQSIVDYGQRKQVLQRDLKKAFERLGEIPEPDPHTAIEIWSHKSRHGY